MTSMPLPHESEMYLASRGGGVCVACVLLWMRMSRNATSYLVRVCIKSDLAREKKLSENRTHDEHERRAKGPSTHAWSWGLLGADHMSCVDRLPSHAADLVLCARVEGPFSRLTSSPPTINSALVGVAYALRNGSRWCAARGRAQSM